MADGNNMEERLAVRVADIAAQVKESAGKLTNSIAEAFTSATATIIERAAQVAEEQAKLQAGHEKNEVDVETTDKILNGAMNNSRFDVKVSLAEGILNGLFCGSGVSLISFHFHQATQAPPNELRRHPDANPPGSEGV